MRNKFAGMLLAVTALGLLGCSDKLTDEAGSDRLENDGNYVYMNVAVALPASTTTRSATDEDGKTNSDGKDNNGDGGDDFEYGYASENNVNTMLLVLAGTDGKYITHAAISGIMQAPVDNTDGTGIGKNFDFIVKEKFSRQDIDAAYKNNVWMQNGQKVNVYVFCNYTANLLKKFEELKEAGGVEEKTGDWLHWTGAVTEDPSKAGSTPSTTSSIWSDHSFLMSNAKVAEVTFPADNDEWNKYTKEDNPFHLSGDPDATDDNGKNYGKPISVERVAARIDYRQYNDEKEGIADNTYPLWTTITATGTENNVGKENLISVQLTRMALVNMSRNFHYLRHVSADGTNSGWETCKAETPYNYVVDTDWEMKKGILGEDEDKKITRKNADTYFNFPLFKKEEKDGYNFDGWYTDNINEVLKHTEDTWTGSESNRYHIWRYITENTIPKADGEDANALQKTVQSVGVVFKGSIVLGKNGDSENLSAEVKKALGEAKKHTPKKGTGVNETNDGYEYPILYFYNNRLFAGFDGLIEKAVASKGNPLLAALDDVLSHWSTNDNGNTYTYSETPIGDETKWLTCDKIKKSNYQFDETDKNFKNLITKNKKMTIYEVSYEDEQTEKGQGWGYYCYYFYWNRHNDNLNNSKMGIMEFATVRNNVYKLQVTKIGELGHPRIPENDPDPVDPEDPDEEDKVYMDVKVEVLPWVVRVNNIEF